MYRPTTTQKLQSAIKDHLIQIQNVQARRKGTNNTRTITPEQFTENLDFLMESGIFSDAVDIRYEFKDNTVHFHIGYMSQCDNSTDAQADLSDGVTQDQIKEHFAVPLE